MLTRAAGFSTKVFTSHQPVGLDLPPADFPAASRTCSSKQSAVKPVILATSALGQDWTVLVDDVICCVVDKLDRPSVRCVRLVCRDWMLAVDNSTEAVCLKSSHIRRLAARFPALKTLDLSGCRRLSNTSIRQLAHSILAPNLQSLQIGPAEVPYLQKPLLTNQGLLCLQRLPSLSSLSLSHCTRITNGGLWQSLIQLSNLTALTLMGCRNISDSGLHVLQQLQGLRRLALSGRKVTDTTLAHIATLPHLLSLHLCACAISENGVTTNIAAMTTLQDLVLSWSPLSYATILALAGLPLLRSLSLLEFSGCCWSDAVMGVCRLTGLTRLYLHGLRLPVVEGRIAMVMEGLVKSLPHLEDLSLMCHWGAGSGDLIRQLAKLQHLRRLGFGSPWGHWSAQLSALSCLTQLHAVQVKCAHLGTAFWSNSLARIPNLQELDLSHNHPPPALPAAIYTYPHAPSPRRPAGELMRHLLSCTAIRTLDISFWNIRGDQLLAIASRLPNLCHVRAYGIQVDTRTQRELESLRHRLTVQLSDAPPL